MSMPPTSSSSPALNCGILNRGGTDLVTLYKKYSTWVRTSNYKCTNLWFVLGPYKYAYMKTLTKYLLLFIIFAPACKKSYLDIVPDNIATIDNAFANRNEAEKYLFTCYSYLPQEGHPDKNPAFSGGDEAWTYWPMTEDYFFLDPYNIARGNMNKVDPYMNYWDGYDNKSLWQGIRACNIFLENLDHVPDVQPYVKTRWIAEAKFLKAYFHWYLFRMYGPIPIVDKNLSVTASPEEVKVYRQP